MDFSAAFNLYAMEQEGLLDTDESRYRKALKLVDQGYSVADAAEEAEIDLDYLPPYQLTELYTHSGEI